MVLAAAAALLLPLLLKLQFQPIKKASRCNNRTPVFGGNLFRAQSPFQRAGYRLYLHIASATAYTAHRRGWRG